ncbi:MAG: dienelactone hydrolase family protein [Bacteroidota bacterium]|nr:dienelactone hydrolase family protein [Bacteroidota bacterium]MDP4237492.1 dienelactone hydrolase family protein [Bacteroidota bacterium]
MIHEKFVLRSREGEKLRADLRYVSNGRRKPIIIFIHGFKGFKDWGPFPNICDQIAARGFVSVAFNFSHNGVGEDLLTFSELDRFAENTFSRELEELSDVIDQLISLDNIPIAAEEVNSDAIGLHGHSRGASIAILAGVRQRLVRAVAAWAPVSHFDRYTARQRQEWRSQGYAEIQNARTGQSMRLNLSLLEDIEVNKDKFNIPASAKKLTSQEKGLLVVVGSEDLTAKPEESESIYGEASKRFAELDIIQNTGHTFGAEHPFKGSTSALEKAIDLTADFFLRYLVNHPIPFPE